MIKFKRLVLDGAFSYGNCDVNFEPGLVLLDGVNTDEGERVSNMAGKTSVFNGLTTVLFEQNSKNQIKDDIINVFGTGSASIGLELEVLGKSVELEYIRGQKPDWTVKVDGKSQTKSMREVKTYISDLIGMDYSVFLVSSYMEQNSLGRLITMKDEEKKNLVTKYFGLDKCDVFRNNTKVPRQQVSGELISVNTLINQLSNVSVDNNLFDTITEVETRVKRLSSTPVSKEQYELVLSKFNEMEVLLTQNANIQIVLEDAKNNLADVNGKMVWCDDVIHKVSGDKCYVCGSKIDGSKLKSEVEQQRKMIMDSRGTLVKQINELERVWSKLRFWDKEKEQRDLEKLKSSVVDVNEYRRDIELLGSLRKQKELQDKALLQLEELKSKKKELDTMLEVLDFWYEGFGPKGIPAMVLDKLLVGLNECIKIYANKFGWDITCIIDNDRLIFDTRDKWKKLKLGFFSGSESTLVGLIVALGVWKWLSLRGKGTNILFLDEVFAPFDAEMRIRVSEILKDIARDRCVVVTTHHEDIKNSVAWDKIWLVEKKSGVSNLKLY